MSLQYQSCHLVRPCPVSAPETYLFLNKQPLIVLKLQIPSALSKHPSETPYLLLKSSTSLAFLPWYPANLAISSKKPLSMPIPLAIQPTLTAIPPPNLLSSSGKKLFTARILLNHLPKEDYTWQGNNLIGLLVQSLFILHTISSVRATK